MYKMNSNSNVLGDYDTSNTSVPYEILAWNYDTNEDSIVVLWNENDEIVYISKMVEVWFEVQVSEIIGEKWMNFLLLDQANEIINHLQTKDERFEMPNLLIKRNSGREFTFHAMIDKININSEKYYICKLKNITHETELKKVLLDSEKLILAGQLSAGLVHEIRNPLTSLKGFLQLLQAGIQQQEKYYNVMIGEIEKLEKITSELLQMAKPFQDIQKNESVSELIQDVIFIMSTQTDLRDVCFVTDLEDDLYIHCNATQIKQALINIIKNGAEAMDKNGVIKITTQKEGDFVAIDVMDEGQGIPDEMVKEVGNPFFTTKPDGTGLGLTITKQIIEIHNGKLRISSYEDVGTNFTILLQAVK